LDLYLHNTLTRGKERFAPIDPERVRMYVCGPTVYQRIHVGNARAFVAFDVLFRLLRHLYGEDKVHYVRNVTDIDDRIIDQARRDGDDIRELTDRTAAQFRDDVAALGCLPPTHEPRATEHVPGMIRLIEALIERGHAYEAEGHVLFNVPSYPAYGRLSGRDRDEQVAGARVEVAPYKRDPADFVLWKPSTDDQPGWDSPWGRGRPGWHIECSAMAEHYLGAPFDIHAGGLDLIFPHHENEIAQTCCARDGLEDMAVFWLHNGFLDMRGEKMSKSLGNVVRVPDALAAADPSPVRQGEIVRAALLWAHYRQPADYTEEAVAEAKQALTKFYTALNAAGVRGRAVAGEGEPDPAMVAALGDDLNLPKARYVLNKLTAEVSRAEDAEEKSQAATRLRASAGLLGLLGEDPPTWLQGGAARPANYVLHAEAVLLSVAAMDAELKVTYGQEHIEAFIAERVAARKARDFARADQIRADLLAQGVILEDRPDGRTDWRRA
jgi:cysteinyl-tRNA synthetase